MYNCHILEECETEAALENVLTQSDSTAIFIDPPFGGRLEPLAYTLDQFDKIRKKCNKSPLSSKNTLLLFFVQIFFIDHYNLHYRVSGIALFHGTICDQLFTWDDNAGL